MGRTSGTRNANFEEKKRAYARRALDSWLESGPGASLREIAAGADMSMSNLRHYFGDREGLFEAITVSALERGRPHMDQSAVNV